MSVHSIADMVFPTIVVLGSSASALEEVMQVIFVETENDPVDFAALNIVCPNINKPGGIASEECRKLIMKAAEAYSRESGLGLHVFFSLDDSLYALPNCPDTEEDAQLRYIQPKTKIGMYAPLVILDAPLDLDKPFEIKPDGTRIFTDCWGVRIKDIPGLVLNDCYPGSDGAVYSIDYSPELKEWTLYRCRRQMRAENNFVITVEKVEHCSLSIIEFNAEPKSASILYDELDKVDICLRGDQVIVLGLPIHNGNF